MSCFLALLFYKQPKLHRSFNTINNQRFKNRTEIQGLKV